VHFEWTLGQPLDFYLSHIKIAMNIIKVVVGVQDPDE
jgi:hypothetical protein